MRVELLLTIKAMNKDNVEAVLGGGVQQLISTPPPAADGGGRCPRHTSAPEDEIV